MKFLNFKKKKLCTICGSHVNFIEDSPNLREGLKCPKCMSISRNRALALVLLHQFCPDKNSIKDALEVFYKMKIYELSCYSPLSKFLRGSKNYTCSEYLDGIKPGNVDPESGIRCEDLRKLTFENQSFDLVISEDVLEHVDGYEKAFREINRVLKTGGFHIFTIPLYGDRKTTKRAITTEKGIVHLLPPEYHGDPLREKILVYTDFGSDIIDILRDFGFKTEIFFPAKKEEEKFGVYRTPVLISEKIKNLSKICTSK